MLKLLKNRSYLLLLVLAFLMSLGLYMARERPVPLDKELLVTREMYDELRDSNRHLREQIQGIKEEIELYSKAVNDEKLRMEVLEQELKNYQMHAGLLDVQGEGVVVLMADSSRVLGEHQNINEYLIHDLDIYQMLSDLRNAGAEVISINDERFLFHHSKVICNGPTIRINGQVFAQPFIIKAIGPRKALQAAINVQGSYADSLRQKGVQIEANTSVLIEIPAFSGTYSTDYMERNEQ